MWSMILFQITLNVFFSKWQGSSYKYLPQYERRQISTVHYTDIKTEIINNENIFTAVNLVKKITSPYYLFLVYAIGALLPWLLWNLKPSLSSMGFGACDGFLKFSQAVPLIRSVTLALKKKLNQWRNHHFKK